MKSIEKIKGILPACCELPSPNGGYAWAAMARGWGPVGHGNSAEEATQDWIAKVISKQYKQEMHIRESVGLSVDK